MKLKVLFSLGLLALASTAANAVPTVYTLQSIRFDNAFAINYRIPGGFFGSGAGTLPGLCTSCGVSTATDDGFGNITIDDAAWNVSGFGQIYSNSFDATTVLGEAVTLTKTNRTCIQIAGGFCSGNFGGLGGSDFWGDLLAQDGVTFSQFANLDVTVVGTELYVARTAALNEANTSSQTYTLIYSTVPVPAAVWLFGSSLGLLGLARRNRKAA